MARHAPFYPLRRIAQLTLDNQADDLRRAHRPPAAPRSVRLPELYGRLEICGAPSRKQGVTVADRLRVVRVAAAQGRQTERRRRFSLAIAPRQQQAGVEDLDRVEWPLGIRLGATLSQATMPHRGHHPVVGVRGDTQSALRVDRGDGLGGRQPRRQPLLDEQRQKLSIGGGNFLTDDYLYPVLLGQGSRLYLTLDGVMVGDGDHSQIGILDGM